MHSSVLAAYPQDSTPFLAVTTPYVFSALCYISVYPGEGARRLQQRSAVLNTQYGTRGLFFLEANCGNVPMLGYATKAETPFSLRGPGFSRFKIKRDWSETETTKLPPHSVNSLHDGNFDRESWAPGLAEFTLGWGCEDPRKPSDLEGGRSGP